MPNRMIPPVQTPVATFATLRAIPEPPFELPPEPPPPDPPPPGGVGGIGGVPPVPPPPSVGVGVGVETGTTTGIGVEATGCGAVRTEGEGCSGTGVTGEASSFFDDPAAGVGSVTDAVATGGVSTVCPAAGVGSDTGSVAAGVGATCGAGADVSVAGAVAFVPCNTPRTRVARSSTSAR